MDWLISEHGFAATCLNIISGIEAELQKVTQRNLQTLALGCSEAQTMTRDKLCGHISRSRQPRSEVSVWACQLTFPERVLYAKPVCNILYFLVFAADDL